MHLTDGTLRANLDGEYHDGAEHVGTCRSCRMRRDRIGSDAAFVAARLRVLDAGVARFATPPTRRRARTWVAATMLLALAVPAVVVGRAASTRWFPQEPAPLALDHQDYARFVRPGSTHETTAGHPRTRVAADAAAASRLSGFTVRVPQRLTPDLEPRATFIVRGAFAYRYRIDRRDGVAAHVTPAVTVSYRDVRSPHAARLTIVEQRIPTFHVFGTDERTIVRELSERAGLSDSAMSAWSSATGDARTIPVAFDRRTQTAKTTYVGTARALLIEKRDGSAGTITWTSDGVGYSIAAPYSGEALQRVAQSLVQLPVTSRRRSTALRP